MAASDLREVVVGGELPAVDMPITRGDLVNYAGAAGDPNPIHYSDHIAALAGLPGVVAHGMLTMGLGAGFVTDWAGDPGRVVSYNVRFTSMVVVPADRPAVVTFSGKVKSIDEETRVATIAITATSDGKRIFGRATAGVRLP
ncbi:MaoC/PaaZ C-terminal domain-containing protein [Millisia brevis]|uniref:MaoC/PaaZ C-terminal domain-containing protein n=1 Tax=Millisia brevis TaxID=264148 RepID=UPI000832E557|nr:MaoC/PaaZ C-terminal domain-containing protein [Millisia brevis]